MQNTNPPTGPYGTPASDPFHSHTQSAVSALTEEILRRTKGWVTLVSILGYIGIAFMVIFGLFMIFGMADSDHQQLVTPAMGFTQIGVSYLFFAALYAYPCIKLTQYSGSITRLLASRATVDLETALDHQRGFWKFCGITSLIGLAATALTFIGAVVLLIIG